MEFMQKHDTVTPEQVIEVPKLSHDSIPQRSTVRRLSSWWKCRRIQCTWPWFSPRRSIRGERFVVFSQDRVQQRLGPSRSLTIQFLKVGGEVAEVFKVYVQDRIQQRLVAQITLLLQIFMIMAIGSGGEAFKVSPRNRVLQRFVEQSTLTFQFLQVVAQGEVFKVFAQDRVHQLLHQWIVITLVMEILMVFFALFPE